MVLSGRNRVRNLQFRGRLALRWHDTQLPYPEALLDYEIPRDVARRSIFVVPGAH